MVNLITDLEFHSVVKRSAISGAAAIATGAGVTIVLAIDTAPLAFQLPQSLWLYRWCCLDHPLATAKISSAAKSTSGATSASCFRKPPESSIASGIDWLIGLQNITNTFVSRVMNSSSSPASERERNHSPQAIESGVDFRAARVQPFLTAQTSMQHHFDALNNMVEQVEFTLLQVELDGVLNAVKHFLSYAPTLEPRTAPPSQNYLPANAKHAPHDENRAARFVAIRRNPALRNARSHQSQPCKWCAMAS